MPIYDYQCEQCEVVTEAIRPATVSAIVCPRCNEDEPEVNERMGVGIAHRQLCFPASIRMADMAVLNKRRQRIKEPIWRDKTTGHATSVW